MATNTENGAPNNSENADGANTSAAAPHQSQFKRFLKIVRWPLKSNRIGNMTAEERDLVRRNAATAAVPKTETVDGAVAEQPKGRVSRLASTLLNWSIDESGERHYWWTLVVSIAAAYNVFVLPARAVFAQLSESPVATLYWTLFDYAGDLVYLADMLVRAKTCFLEQGLLVRDPKRLAVAYVKSRQFILDAISVFPTDILYFFWYNSFWRFNRLLRIGRVFSWVERTETRSAYPNAFRVACVVCYIVIIIHWNGCLYYALSEYFGRESDEWVCGMTNPQYYGNNQSDTLVRRYLYSFYWSTLTLTTIGETPWPVQDLQFLFVTADFLVGVLIFATIVGNVGSMISNMSAARTEFQHRMDSIKQYMTFRKVGKQMETRVIKWFDYLWSNKQGASDDAVLETLPTKLQTEIATHVHFATLKKVKIFQDCEAGLLSELVLNLKLQVFSPGDYICRKGDIGREMYIVKRGKVAVVAPDGIKVFVTLSEGAVFGELSILNIVGSKNGNRRTANIRSVGYSDLFALTKDDLWHALKEYPDARKLMILTGRQILQKDNLLDADAPEEQATMEEKCDDLIGLSETLTTRLARLLGEWSSTCSKLDERISKLGSVVDKYAAIELASREANCPPASRKSARKKAGRRPAENLRKA